jgi:hypothetical protein
MSQEIDNPDCVGAYPRGVTSPLYHGDFPLA